MDEKMDEKQAHTAYTDEEIFDKVGEIIGKIMMISPDEISSNASLVVDLGMESIDFLDVAFKLEETFGIELPRKNPIQRFIRQFGKEEFVQEDGSITSKGLKFLRVAFPEVDPDRLSDGLKEEDIMSLVSVQTYVNIVKRGLEIAHWRPERCGTCGKREFVPFDKETLELSEGEELPLGPVFQCKSCNAIARPPSFDEKLIMELS